MVNGISGSDSRYGDKEWLGFWGEDIEIVIDLGEETDINSIETRFHNGQGQWIYSPNEIDIVLDDLPIVYNTKINQSNLIAKPLIPFKKRMARIIKIRVPNYGIIPEGKQGAGNKAWTFIDEIIVN